MQKISTEIQSHCYNLAVEPLSFSTSSSIWTNTGFFSSLPALTNFFTRLPKLASIPAYIKKYKIDQENKMRYIVILLQI